MQTSFKSVRNVVSVTRPADTTAYSVGDVFFGAFIFQNCTTPERGTGFIDSIGFKALNPSYLPAIELIFFNGVPDMVTTDNVAATFGASDWDICLGSIIVVAATWRVFGASKLGTLINTDFPYKLSPDTPLVVVPVTQSAGAPLSAEVLQIDLSLLLD